MTRKKKCKKKNTTRGVEVLLESYHGGEVHENEFVVEVRVLVYTIHHQIFQIG
jgi:uncharacterized membrane protein